MEESSLAVLWIQSEKLEQVFSGSVMDVNLQRCGTVLPDSVMDLIKKKRMNSFSGSVMDVSLQSCGTAFLDSLIDLIRKMVAQFLAVLWISICKAVE